MPVSDRLADFLHASGVRVHPGETGLLYQGRWGGEIRLARASIRGFDAHLYGALKCLVDETGLAINISHVDTGRHAVNSRHYKGCAVDIYQIGEDRRTLRDCSLENAAALKAFFWFRSKGWRIGERIAGQAVPGVIFGPARTAYNPTSGSHATHLHVSIIGQYKKR